MGRNAAELAIADTTNAAIYTINAGLLVSELGDLDNELASLLVRARGPYLVL